MAKRTRVSLSALADDLADDLDQPSSGGAGGIIAAPLADLTPNPRNPRDSIGDLSDLASITEVQLQPATAITAAAYHALYPDDEITTPYVIIIGCRRYAAAVHYGRPTLDIIVNDELARDRATLITNAVRENIERLGLDIIEEAKAVDELATEAGSARAAAAQLGRTESWVSQRRALLGLHPDLQEKLRAGELAIREARSLATVPLKFQVDRWLAHRDQSATPKKKRGATPAPRKAQRAVTNALSTFPAKPGDLAAALRAALGDDGITILVAEFAKATNTGTVT